MTETPDRSAGSRCLILFARAPLAGRVKSRLVPALGEAGALTLYRQLLRRQIALVNSYANASRQCWLDGDPGHPDLVEFDGAMHRQQGADLGERMHLALSAALETAESAVLIGCDCPWLDGDYLDRAFAALERGRAAVFGPAADGGYVLVGLRQSCAALFRQVDWGGDAVMAQTRVKLRNLALAWEELPVLHDIDEPQDLARLPTDAGGEWVL